MKEIQNISRRSFIKGLGLASGGLIIACNSNLLTTSNKEVTKFNPNLFIQLNSDGNLILIASRSEMGNGARTSLTSILADEMEADWNRVTVKQATGDKKYGNQNTDGSKSVRYLYDHLRELGATTKAILIASAAQKWNLSPDECYAENHYIYTKKGKKIAYGDLVEIAKTIETPKKITLKSPKDFKYIGKKLPSIDVHDFVTGNATFGLDKRIPNMAFAAIEHCPVTYGTVKSFDKTEALKIKGVIDIIEIPLMEKAYGSLGGIAVIASNTWAAFKGKDALKINWDLGANQNYNSEEYMELLTNNVHKPGKVERSVGNTKNAFDNTENLIEATYQLPHLAHTPMEVPNAVAWVKDSSCEVWTPSQSPQTTRNEVANCLNFDQEQVTVNVTLLGGGFGRKAKPDYVVEAAILSKATKRPIQVVWSREDDIHNGYFHTVSAQYLKASITKDGKVDGWLHRGAFPSISSTFKPGTEYPSNGELGSAKFIPFDIPNIHIESGKAPAHVRIGWYRSVIHLPHAFAQNIFIDELAHKANIDSLEFRLNLIGKDRVAQNNNKYKLDTSRLKNVLKTAAKSAKWGENLPEGHALGIAMHYSFFSYVATVVEVSVIEGKLKVHNVYTAIDCGTTVNKDTIASQMEGAAIFGMSLTYYGKITAKDGAIQQNNFDDYPMLRMSEAPKVHVDIIESDAPPSGVGEPGVPVIAPAILNAIFNATGKRYRSLPLSDQGLV